MFDVRRPSEATVEVDWLELTFTGAPTAREGEDVHRTYATQGWTFPWGGDGRLQPWPWPITSAYAGFNVSFGRGWTFRRVGPYQRDARTSPSYDDDDDDDVVVCARVYVCTAARSGICRCTRKRHPKPPLTRGYESGSVGWATPYSNGEGAVPFELHFTSGITRECNKRPTHTALANEHEMAAIATNAIAMADCGFHKTFAVVVPFSHKPIPLDDCNCTELESGGEKPFSMGLFSPESGALYIQNVNFDKCLG
ncbi:hypothetical protein ZHAS_00000853 [Anopheles sinensis]|uniref:Uncharacterized protein n=1 Tax=Anopheles sinensis TaxID=74873 RepID=A0A084VAP0_ANOSI|nr:hypothetical protein ZHAS_00000853 [Anopheles sinensis]